MSASRVSQRSSEAVTPATGVAERLAAFLVEAAERYVTTPCIIARSIDAPVVVALTQALPALRANGLTPLLLLAERPDPTRAPRDVAIRTVSADIASLLREQVIAGDFVWCGGSASRHEPQTEGRLFATLSPTELRAFAIVFQGLWASGRPLAAARAEQAATPSSGWRHALAGGAR